MKCDFCRAKLEEVCFVIEKRGDKSVMSAVTLEEAQKCEGLKVCLPRSDECDEKLKKRWEKEHVDQEH